MLYNGKDEYPEKSTLYLSDAFGDSNMDNRELKVKVYNVNKGHNLKIMCQSETLKEYSVFVGRVYENKDNGFELAEALEKAVKDCIKDDILKNFLEKYGSDVINMLSLEFNLDDAKRVWKKDGIIEGEQKKAEEIAESLLNILDIETIAEKTKLSVEEIRELKIKHENKV